MSSINRISNMDFSSLNELKNKAKDDAQSALPAVAKQFEGIFLQTMMKSMRMGQHFLDEHSVFRSEHQETFQNMLDGQYVDEMTENSGIGLAKMLAEQLRRQVPNTTKTEDSKAVKDVPSATDVTNKPQGVVGQFVEQMMPYAKEAASALGLDPAILLAQAALETGWGQHVAKDDQGNSSYNLFNIKATASHPEAVKTKTTEFVADKEIKTDAAFRKYQGVGHSFADYVQFLQNNPRYQNALAETGNPERFVKALQQAGYATDPQYADKIMGIYHSPELQAALKSS